ncbi:MAG: hypothetical protein ABIJ17_01520 [Patescibacteria group bacterium]
MKLPVITNQDIKKTNPYCFLIYSDNILEGINILDLLSENNRFLSLIGVSYEPIDQPIYLFKEKINKKYICIKVIGKYENWELSSNVQDIIGFIDKPDFVIVDGEKNKEIFVGETTGTTNVGNSQWQREGRKISAALKEIPMIYQTYYFGTDRSMFSLDLIDSGEEKGQIRQPTSLQVINHFIYSLRYRTPSFVVYYQNQEYDSVIKFNKGGICGTELLKEYISIILLNSIEGSYKQQKKKTEIQICKHMLDYINELVSYRNSKIKRINKDFLINPVNKILKEEGKNFIKYLIDYINHDSDFDKKFSLVNWNYKTFYKWSHRYKKTRLLKLLAKNKIKFLSYLPSTTKAGFTLDTSSLIEFLNKIYPEDNGKFFLKFNDKIPTLIIPTLMFQKRKNKYINKVDPGTGEIAAFSELFGKNLENKKTMNILIYVHVKGPEKLSTNTKLFKSIKHYADCVIINEKIYEF